MPTYWLFLKNDARPKKLWHSNYFLPLKACVIIINTRSYHRHNDAVNKISLLKNLRRYVYVTVSSLVISRWTARSLSRYHQPRLRQYCEIQVHFCQTVAFLQVQCLVSIDTSSYSTSEHLQIWDSNIGPLFRTPLSITCALKGYIPAWSASKRQDPVRTIWIKHLVQASTLQHRCESVIDQSQNCDRERTVMCSTAISQAH